MNTSSSDNQNLTEEQKASIAVVNSRWVSALDYVDQMRASACFEEADEAEASANKRFQAEIDAIMNKSS